MPAVAPSYIAFSTSLSTHCRMKVRVAMAYCFELQLPYKKRKSGTDSKIEFISVECFLLVVQEMPCLSTRINIVRVHRMYKNRKHGTYSILTESGDRE